MSEEDELDTKEPTDALLADDGIDPDLGVDPTDLDEIDDIPEEEDDFS